VQVYANATNQLDDLETQQAKKKKTSDSDDEDDEELTFEQVYMQQITESLADELDELKEREKIEDEAKVAQLVDCLQLGMDFYGDLERDLCVQGWKRTNAKQHKHQQQKKKGLHQALQELY
jgi:hypothetical protein